MTRCCIKECTFRFSEFLLTPPPNQVSYPPRSVPAGGAYASSRHAGRDAVAATASSRRAMSTGLVQHCAGLPAWCGCEVFADVEIVWSWHPDADAKLAGDDSPPVTGARQPVPGEITYKT